MSEIVKAIAIDYDGCIAINSWPSVGEPNWDVINRAKAEQAKGAKLILWTCREGHKLEEALDAEDDSDVHDAEITFEHDKSSDKGWKVTVDGKEVETVKALGSLVAFYIDGAAGQTHTVEMVYRPNTFVIGMTVSLIFTALLILIIVFEKRIRRIRGLRMMVGVPGDETLNVQIEANTPENTEKMLTAPEKAPEPVAEEVSDSTDEKQS